MDAFELEDVIAEHARLGERYHEFFVAPRLSLGLYLLPAGQPAPQQPHTEDEVYYVIQGQGMIRVGEEDRPVAAGSLVYVDEAVEHRSHRITEDLSILRAMNSLAWALKDHGPEQLAAAEDLAREATDFCLRLLGEEDELTPMTMDTLAVVLHMRGKNQEAILEFDQVAAAARKTAGEDRWFTLMSPVYYGRCLLELDRYEDAETVLQTTYAGVKELNGEEHESTQSALAALVDLYEAWGKPEQAAEWRAKLPREERSNEQEAPR